MVRIALSIWPKALAGISHASILTTEYASCRFLLSSYLRPPGPVPIRTLTLWTDCRVCRDLSRYPFMLAALTGVAPDLDSLFCHVGQYIPLRIERKRFLS